MTRTFWNSPSSNGQGSIKIYTINYFPPRHSGYNTTEPKELWPSSQDFTYP